jgi:hypothetical protein
MEWGTLLTQTVGTIGAISFLAAIVLAFLGRRWFASRSKKKVQLGADILAGLGGWERAREVSSMIEERLQMADRR